MIPPPLHLSRVLFQIAGRAVNVVKRLSDSRRSAIDRSLMGNIFRAGERVFPTSLAKPLPLIEQCIFHDLQIARNKILQSLFILPIPYFFHAILHIATCSVVLIKVF